MTAESTDIDAAQPSRRHRLAVLGFGYVSAMVAERALSCGLLSIGCPKVAQHSPPPSWLLAQLQAFLLELWMFPAGLVYVCAMVGSANPALANLAAPLGDWSAFSAHLV